MDFKYHITEEKEIEVFLKEVNFSKYMIRAIKDRIIVNGNPKRKWEKLFPGDILEISFEKEKSSIIPTKGALDIIYEDEYLLVINKPIHMAVMPNRRYYYDSLSNIVMYYYKEKNIDSTIHLVNRLDKETSGLVLIAKNQFIHSLFSKIDIKKKYYAVAKGIIENDGIIDLPISKGEGIRRVVGFGKESVTKYRVLKKNFNTLLDIDLLSGRTHQIRVHLNAINHPILGDELYDEGDNLHLQSYYISFLHPVTGEKMEFIQDLEKRMEKDI